MHKRFFLGIISIALSLYQPVCAQNEGSVWYFGQHAGLDFKDQYPKPLIDGKTNSSEGVAAISDANGNLLFYTDGQTVYDSTHQIMTNGAGLYGNNSATQSSIIVPWPHHPGQYYVFTVGKAGPVANPGKGLYYTIIDMNSNRADPNNLNVQLLEICTEKITAIKHNNGVDWWILAHEINSTLFKEFHVSDALLQSSQVITKNIGLTHLVDRANPDDKGALGYLKGSPNGDFVALAIEGAKYFEVFRFDNTTGVLLENPMPIKLQTESAYGVEFSPTGKYLYGSNRQDGMIYRWKLDDFKETSVKGSREIILSNPGLSCGALQLALNGKIYVALNNKPYLGVINAPDLDTCRFVERGASLTDYASGFRGVSGFGLPNIPPVYFKDSIYYSNSCVNDTTVIYLASRDYVDDIRVWHIDGKVLTGDPLTNRVYYVFKAPGEYPIRVDALKNGQPITIKGSVRIHPLPVLNLKATYDICAGQPVELHRGDYAFYGITDGAGLYSDSVRSIDQPGSYTATVTNYEGCTTAVTTVVRSIAQTVRIERIPPDPSPVCPGTQVLLQATGADNIIWEHDADIKENMVWVNPDTTTIYKVTGTIGGCSFTDSIQILVFENNILNLGPDTTACMGSTIVLRGKDYDPGSKYVEWNWSTGEKTDSIILNNTISNLYLGVKDVNGCLYSDNIDITFDLSLNVRIRSSVPVTSPVCPGLPITLMASGANSFTWRHDPTLLNNSATVYPDRDTVFKVFGNGGGSCNGSDSIIIKVYPPYPLDLGSAAPACAGDSIVLRVKDFDPGNVYTDWIWAPGGRVDSLVLTGPSVNQFLTVTDLNGCSYTDSINITFNPVPEISVVTTDINCFGPGSLEIKVKGNPASVQYSIDGGGTWSDQKKYSGLLAGDYVALAKLETGCVSLPDTATIIEWGPLAYVIDSVAPSCLKCTDGEIRIHVTGGQAPYTIRSEGEIVQDSVFSNLGAGQYSFSLTDANECTLPFDVFLTAAVLVIPDAFSPNGGTKNEKWMVRVLDNRTDCLVQVYDRSGKVVFYNAGVYEPWDGTYLNQGNQLPAGTYFYLIRIDRKDQNKPPQRGTVTILR